MVVNSVTLVDQWKDFLTRVLSPDSLAFNRIIDATFTIKQLEANKSLTLTKVILGKAVVNK